MNYRKYWSKYLQRASWEIIFELKMSQKSLKGNQMHEIFTVNIQLKVLLQVVYFFELNLIIKKK